MKKLLLVALVVGCAGSTAPAPPTAGSLTVTVTSSGQLIPEITVKGPSGFTKTIAATTSLTGLAPGLYTLTAASITTLDSVVGSVYQAAITGSPATVSAGGNAIATVNYAVRPGSGALWVVGGIPVGANTQNTAVAYSTSQLTPASRSATPAIALDFPVTQSSAIDVLGVAFDAGGNLWVANESSNTVVEYLVAGLSRSGSPTPAVTLPLPDSAPNAQALAFDGAGNLWVLNSRAANVVEFTPAQLRTGGSATPAVIIAVTAGQPANVFPRSMAFDAQGNLWVASPYGSLTFGSIVKYTPSQLSSSGTPVPAVSLLAQVSQPYAIAFDAAGNLWVSSSPYIGNSVLYSGQIFELAASSLTASGSPSPVVTLTLPAGNPYGAAPSGMAFDDNGNLWYADFYNGWVGELTATQLATSGNPSPTVAIADVTTLYGYGLAFNPHSGSLPLH